VTTAQYARKLAREYGITDKAEIATIATQLDADTKRHDELRAMSEGRA
jgi:hypothetical protein